MGPIIVSGRSAAWRAVLQPRLSKVAFFRIKNAGFQPETHFSETSYIKNVTIVTLSVSAPLRPQTSKQLKYIVWKEIFGVKLSCSEHLGIFSFGKILLLGGQNWTSNQERTLRIKFLFQAVFLSWQLAPSLSNNRAAFALMLWPQIHYRYKCKYKCNCIYTYKELLVHQITG